MPQTALRHFNEDIGRARAMVAHATPLPTGNDAEVLLREDILRSAWMFSVGAMDAYFCDAYADIIAATMLCKSREPTVPLPGHVDDLRVPVSTVLEVRPQRENWKWRMAARSLIERQNILSLGSVQQHFNKFCRNGHRFFGDVIDSWATRYDATARVFGTTPTVYASTTGAARKSQRQDSLEAMKQRFDEVIFQRRHDCIHNCDRPKVAPQRLRLPGTVGNVIRDTEFLVSRFDDHLGAEAHHFLSGLGFSNATIAQVGY
ncbi:hypothetical protein KQH29_00445 [bacterium]|nr:hypothetical protein [bacterium]